MNNAKKPEKKKAVAQAAAENKSVVNEAPATEVKTETKTTSVPFAAKPAAKTTTKKAASKTEAVKKTAAKPAAKKAVVNTAKAPKAAAKTTTKAAEKTNLKSTEKAAAKTASKTTAKSAANKTAKTETAKAPAKRGGRKPAPVTIDTICAKLEKKIDKRKVSSIKEKIAVEIEVWGFEDGSNSFMYVEVDNGKVTVSPHNYETKNFRVSLSCANAVAFINGNIALKKLIESDEFYAEGNIVSAVKLAALL